MLKACIEVPVGFINCPLYPAKENCDKCGFSAYGLCSSRIDGVRDRCHYGQRGYWVFDETPRGRVEEAGE
jgi:hypothetical protein